MKKVRNLLRPLFRLVTKPHIRQLCRSTYNEFTSYRGKYTGQRCFIVANGPSLRMEDLDKLSANGEISFGMNRIYMLYDRTQWRPTFYLTQDPTVIRSCYGEMKECVKESVMFVKVPGEPKYDLPGAIYFDMDYNNSEKNISPNFYDGSNCLFADGRSVSYTALQLAVYMGFTTIYLIGADCYYSTDNKKINKDSYPDKRMYDEKKVGMPPNIEYMFTAYRSAQSFAENHGVKIYNATRGGKLEVFKRVDFDDLF